MTRHESINERTVRLLEFAYGSEGSTERAQTVSRVLSRLATDSALGQLAENDNEQLPEYQTDFSDACSISPLVWERMVGYLDTYEQFADPIKQLQGGIANHEPVVVLGEGRYADVYKIHVDETPYAVRIHKNPQHQDFNQATYDLMHAHAEVADNDGFANLIAVDGLSGTSVTEYVGTSLYQIGADEALSITSSHFERAFATLHAAAKAGVSIDAHSGNVCYDPAGDRLVHIDPEPSGRFISDATVAGNYRNILEVTSLSALAGDYIHDGVRTPEAVAAYKAQRHLMHEFATAVMSRYGKDMINSAYLDSMLEMYGLYLQGDTLDSVME